MKKTAVVLMTVFALSLMAAGIPVAHADHSYQTSKKSVKKNPDYRRGREVKYFKVSIQEDGEEKVSLTLPIALIDFIMEHSRDLDIDMDHCHLDIKALWRHIKRLGPKAIIEVGDGHEMVKVWLE